MGYIFVYDNVIMLCVTNTIWEEFKVAMSIACIAYLKQAELIANIYTSNTLKGMAAHKRGCKKKFPEPII